MGIRRRRPWKAIVRHRALKYHEVASTLAVSTPMERRRGERGEQRTESGNKHAWRPALGSPCFRHSAARAIAGRVRMRFLVRIPQALSAHMRVDLRCREAFVPEQFLHASQIGTAVQQVRREAVS